MSDFVIDFNRVKRSELQDLFADMDKVVSAKDVTGFAILDKWMARTITKWPFAGEPGDETGYQDMGLEDYMEAIRQFSAGFRRISNPDDRSGNGRPKNGKSNGVDTRQRAAGSVEPTNV